jgi:signal transduction histidine kinase/CheY-like chemotaxis protein
MLVRLRWLAFSALERRLFLTVAVGLLPLAAFAFFTLFQSAQRQRQDVIEGSEGTMRAIVSAVDSELDASLASLDALAASPRLARNDFKGFHAESRELLARRPNWLNIVLSDRGAQQLMNAYLPLGATLPRRVDPQSIEETVRTGVPGVGNVFFSPVLETYVFAVRAPIKRAGSVASVLMAGIKPDVIQQILRAQRLEDDAVVVVVDKKYNVVARTLNQASSVGKPVSPTLVQLLQLGKPSGWTTTTTLEGVPVYTIYYRSPRSGWSAVVGIPTAALDAPIRHSYIILGGSILASVVLGLMAAFWVSRTITRPMRQLKLAADEVGVGREPVMPETQLPEIRQVANALVSAYTHRESLLRSERQARSFEHEARLLAERSSRMKDEFLAMLGHELRNPLAAISSASLVLEHALRKPTTGPGMEKSVAIIRRQIQHLARLTDDLLDAGRVVMGRIQLEREPIDLAIVVQNTLDALRSTQRLANHTVNTWLTPAWVNADATRIDQIVTNLLTNAVRYTPSPGRIDVRVERSGDQVTLRIRDSGIGVEPELIPRIFDLFVQGERALDRSSGGLGIGLTLVQRLTELHGGRVEVRSAGTGLGSEFIVQLPAIEPPAHAAAPPAEPRASGSRRIAIVEDNEDVRTSLRQLLELAGHEIFEAADGQAGVEVVLRERPQVALIDIGLPIMDGYAVARAVRAAMHGYPINLVALTGYGNPEDVQAGLRAGFDNYLVKPVDPARLYELVANTS